MLQVTLGRTGITVNKNGFGALPIQRTDMESAKRILRKAYENGVRFFDTAHGYTDSEEKIGYALSEVRAHIFISTKVNRFTVEEFRDQLETSLRRMKTDYIDIYQFHNPSFVPRPGDGTGLYEAMLEAKKQGKIRFIGFTNHRIDLAREAVESGLYDTLQFPFSYLASDSELELVRLCKEKNVGFLCMKALSGGLITNSAAAYAYLATIDNALPIWGIQRESELDQFLSYQENAPILTGVLEEQIKKDRRELVGSFCRGCGYCMPCPVGIQINNCARMSLMLRRAPTGNWLSETWQKNMEKIEDCLHCNACAGKCPYGLDTPALLRKNLEDYRTFLK